MSVIIRPKSFRTHTGKIHREERGDTEKPAKDYKSSQPQPPTQLIHLPHMQTLPSSNYHFITFLPAPNHSDTYESRHLKPYLSRSTIELTFSEQAHHVPAHVFLPHLSVVHREYASRSLEDLFISTPNKEPFFILDSKQVSDTINKKMIPKWYKRSPMTPRDFFNEYFPKDFCEYLSHHGLRVSDIPQNLSKRGLIPLELGKDLFLSCYMSRV